VQGSAAWRDAMMSPEIIDDVSPHHWSASTVLQDWDNDYEAYSKAEYVTNPFMQLLQPTHIDIDSSDA
jgi:hypothetical protein